MSHHKVRHRGTAALGTIVLAFAFSVAATGTAEAAQQSRTINQKLSGVGVPIEFFDSGLLVCDGCVPDFLVSGWDNAGAGISVSADLKTAWTSDTSTAISYNDALLRQGTTLDTSDTMTTSGGQIVATFGVQAFAGLVVRDDPEVPENPWLQTTTSLTLNPSVDVNIPCDLPASGSTVTCESAPEKIPLLSYTLLPGVDLAVQLWVRVAADVSGDGVVTVRKAEVTGGFVNGPNATLTFSPTVDTQADPMAITCNQPVGNDLKYAFTDTYADTSLALNVPVSLWFGVDFDDLIPVPDLGIETPPIVTVPLGSTTLHLTAPDASANLGPVLADNLPPTVVTAATYTGVEGTPLQLDGSGSSDNCGFPTLRWDFSDGGVAFGAKPFHTFADNGTYSGLLTATDATGNTASKTFRVTVSNAAPDSAAGPDGSGAWGRDIAFNGFGTDPGAGDQSTLTYQWDFGDGGGTPTVTSASGGYSVAHAYATPNTYTATLTVCDKNGACDTETRDVIVRKRAVDVAQLGDTAGTYDTAGSLRGSITDEFGLAVSGRTLSFTVDGNAAGTALTNGLGRGTTAYTPLVNAGTHTAMASFSGDSLYVNGSSSNGLDIALKASTTTYTGALTGGANKTITLSGTLKDATGKTLTGRTLVFKLGTQSVTVTDAANTGVYSAQLKLNQKNGTYPLTATWTPTGADANRYVGSFASAVFKLQAR